MSIDAVTKLPLTDQRLQRSRRIGGFDRYNVDRQIIGLYALGYDDTSIPELVDATYSATRNRVRRSREAIGVTTVAALVHWAIDNGVILPLIMDKPMDLDEVDRRIVILIAKGKNNREIGQALYMSIHGIRTRVERMLDRNGAFTRQHLVALWASQDYYDRAYFLGRATRRADWDERMEGNWRGYTEASDNPM